MVVISFTTSGIIIIFLGKPLMMVTYGLKIKHESSFSSCVFAIFVHALISTPWYALKKGDLTPMNIEWGVHLFYCFLLFFVSNKKNKIK